MIQTALPSLAGILPPIVPQTRLPVSIRQATVKDLGFIDALQKRHSNAVSFWPRVQLEGYVEGGFVLIAEDEGKQPLGYCISKDRYFKRDDVGVVFQLNVVPGAHRKLIGAMLIKAVFDRAAYGCKLFSCWCAQDIAANHFWESIGFVPLAFRTGGRGRSRGARVANPCHQPGSPRHRIHIFWQRRIREGDTETPYWYPSQTGAGAIREDRLVFPIPPGTHWSDAKPVILPGCSVHRANAEDGTPPLPLQSHPRKREREPKRDRVATARLRTPEQLATLRAKSKHLKGCPPGKIELRFGGRVVYVDDPSYVPTVEEPQPTERLKREKQPNPRWKNDPRHVGMARELRDRYLEEINSERMLPPAGSGKYDVSRQLEAAPTKLNPAVPLLKAA